MSLILDALNRSRQDTDEVPSLATQHYVDGDIAPGSNWPQYLLWLALLTALVVIAWLLLAGTPDTPVASNTPQPAAQPRAREIVQEQATVTAPVAMPVDARQGSAAQAPPVAAKVSPVAAQPQADSDPAVAALYQQRAVPQPAATKPRTTEVAQVETVEEQQPAVPGLAGEQSAESSAQEVKAVEREEQPIDIEKMVLQARGDLENAQLEQHQAPFIASLSQQTKDNIPSIFYQRHDYSGTPSQSSVVLNGKTVKAGGSAASGVKVDEILPDSVVLTYRGTQFRLRALNSWVNL